MKFAKKKYIIKYMFCNTTEYYDYLFNISGYNEYGMAQISVKVKYFNKGIDYDKFIVHIINILSKALLLSQKSGLNQYIVYVYLEEVQIKNLDITFFKNMINLLNQAFPNALYKCYLINFPLMIKPVYKLLSKMIDKETKAKFKIIKNIV